MRLLACTLLALPVLAAAGDQVPLSEKLKGWFNKAQEKAQAIVSSGVSSGVPSPVSTLVEPESAKVVQLVVEKLNLTNWKDILTPSTANDDPEEWMVYITGGNATCYGLCGNATEAWNQSVALLATDPAPPKLAIIDCDEDPILCNSWAVGPPSIYHMLLPQPLPDQTKPATTVRYIRLSRNATTASNITEIHTKQTYNDFEPYEGYFHPFDGDFQKYDLAVPIAYAMWGFSRMPSWLPMIAVSFLSRQMMSRRMANQARPRAPQGGASAAPPS